jgi:hypothetical protein
MRTASYQRFFETALIVGAPLALAILESFHPQPRALANHDLLHLDQHLPTWLLVHYLQIVLFPLVALAMVVLVRNGSGIAVALCHVAMFVFAVSYVAFDTAAGVVTGILVQAAQASGTPEAWRAPVTEIWTHPIVGGAPDTTPVLAVVGTMAWTVGTLAAAVGIRRAGYSWIPVVFLIISAFGLFLFRTHAWPGGPVSFGALAAGGAWLLWERTRSRSAQTNPGEV